MLHGSGGLDDLRALSIDTIKSILKGVAEGAVSKSALAEGMPVIDFLAESGACSSRGDARRKLLADRCVSINTVKTVEEERRITADDLIHDQLILVNLGKRNRVVVYVKD